jgi:hypothetical protein
MINGLTHWLRFDDKIYKYTRSLPIGYPGYRCMLGETVVVVCFVVGGVVERGEGLVHGERSGRSHQSDVRHLGLRHVAQVQSLELLSGADMLALACQHRYMI